MKQTNFIYLYDGSFIHLLTIIRYLLIKKEIPLDIKSDYQPNLLDEVIRLDLPLDYSLINSFRKKVGEKIFKTVYYIYLAQDSNKEMLIFHFIKESLKYQNNIFYMHNIENISQALKVSLRVSRENHKMKGFIRFKELNNNVLYAQMAPTNNVLPILVNHFKLRFKNEKWIIHDVNRHILGLYDKKKVYLVKEEDLHITLANESSLEKEIAALWQSFYQTIGIKERKNDRCRMNFMPKKYWQYITEMRDEV